MKRFSRLTAGSTAVVAGFALAAGGFIGQAAMAVSEGDGEDGGAPATTEEPAAPAEGENEGDGEPAPEEEAPAATYAAVVNFDCDDFAASTITFPDALSDGTKVDYVVAGGFGGSPNYEVNTPYPQSLFDEIKQAESRGLFAMAGEQEVKAQPLPDLSKKANCPADEEEEATPDEEETPEFVPNLAPYTVTAQLDCEDPAKDFVTFPSYLDDEQTKVKSVTDGYTVFLPGATYTGEDYKAAIEGTLTGTTFDGDTFNFKVVVRDRADFCEEEPAPAPAPEPEPAPAPECTPEWVTAPWSRVPEQINGYDVFSVEGDNGYSYGPNNPIPADVKIFEVLGEDDMVLWNSCFEKPAPPVECVPEWVPAPWSNLPKKINGFDVFKAVGDNGYVYGPGVRIPADVKIFEVLGQDDVLLWNSCFEKPAPAPAPEPAPECVVDEQEVVAPWKNVPETYKGEEVHYAEVTIPAGYDWQLGPKARVPEGGTIIYRLVGANEKLLWDACMGPLVTEDPVVPPAVDPTDDPTEDTKVVKVVKKELAKTGVEVSSLAGLAALFALAGAAGIIAARKRA